MIVAGIAAGLGFPRAETRADDRPRRAPVRWSTDRPPQQYKIGTTLILLRGEIAVTSVQLDPDHLSVLTVAVEPDEIPIEPCLPNTVVRILSQDAYSVRIAAYRYGVGPDQNEGHQCTNPGPAPTTLGLDLQSPLAEPHGVRRQHR